MPHITAEPRERSVSQESTVAIRPPPDGYSRLPPSPFGHFLQTSNTFRCTS